MHNLVGRSRSCVALLFPDSNNPDRPGNKKPPGRLILPNEGPRQSPKSGPRLVVPGQSTNPSPPPPSNSTLITEPDPTMDGGSDTRRTYRPPQGYFAKAKTPDPAAEFSAELMLQKLKTWTDRWHVLACFLPKLNDQGYDSIVIEGFTGITKAEQSILAIASSVRQSIVSFLEAKKPDYITLDDLTEFYDIEGTHFALYELRFLDIEERAMCAAFVAQNQFDAKASQDLARSTKEYYRRKSETEGFEPIPEDILAFKFYRNAIESREESLISSFVQKGIEIAKSEPAKDRLRELLTEHDKIQETKQKISKAKIEMYRMLTTDLLFRPIPFAGDFFKVNCEIFESAPWATQSGEFGVFAIHKEEEGQKSETEWKWMALPNWPLLSKAKRPVSLVIRNCSKIKAIVKSARAKTEEEMRRLSGPGMLVFDLSNTTLISNEFYLVKGEDACPVIKAGEDLEEDGNEVLGKVLLLCRPPDKESIDSFET